MDRELLEQVRRSLPPYLAAEEKQALLDQLSGHSTRPEYYGRVDGDDEPLQGDGWQGLTAFDFDSGARDQLQGLVLSNSCDIAAANNPYTEQRIVYSPLLSLRLYQEFLIAEGHGPEKVDELAHRIRQQKVHRIFYLPPMEGVREESIVALDLLHSQPLDSVRGHGLRRLFTLSTFGWYMLLLKISIHFLRMQEAVERKAVART